MNLLEIWAKKQELDARVIRDGATERDVEIAAELVSQYIDELERLEKTVKVKPFLSADEVADKVLSFWRYDE